MKRVFLLSLLTIGLILWAGSSESAKRPSFEGYKKCGGCHKSQKESWLETAHAKAFNSLKAGVKAEEKERAGLDPDKEYRGDKDCVGCHVTGFKKMGGYKKSMPKTKRKFLMTVGCESCHGPGAIYRKDHRKAGNKFKKTGDASPRKPLVKAGEIFDYKEACYSCHMSYEGSPWAGAKEPYTPFTPEVDKKYEFDYENSVREKGKGKAMHEHFKLRGVYTGPPVPAMREEFQKDAKEPAEPDEE